MNFNVQVDDSGNRNWFLNEMGSHETYNVSLEIIIDASSPYEAAKTLQDWIRDKNTNWTFNVQKEGEKEVFTVDLEEDIEATAVLPVTDYRPLIS
jgi:hypothetical protein